MRVYVRTFVLCMAVVLLSLLFVYIKYDADSSSLGLKEVKTSARKAKHRPASQEVGDVQHKVNSAGRRETLMHLAVVACGQRLGEAVNMLKTAVMLSSRAIRFHVFAEDQSHGNIKATLDSWPAFISLKFSYVVHPISFPRENHEEWSQLFKPCASQRLFLPVSVTVMAQNFNADSHACLCSFVADLVKHQPALSLEVNDQAYNARSCGTSKSSSSETQHMLMILRNVDSLLYVDTDVLFLQPVELIWDMLSHFNSTQLVAMAPEHEEPRIAWYSRFSRHPYYGKTGINSGVMLMNLTRMRTAQFKNDMTSVGLHWHELLMPLLQKYNLNITWGDQDLINIIFHYNPEMVFVFPCNWNYRPDHCIYGSNCNPAEEDGVVTLHGNRGVFHSDKQPAFKAVYQAFKHYIFGEDLLRSFFLPLEVALNATTHTYCGKVSHFFTRALEKSVRRIQRATAPGG